MAQEVNYVALSSFRYEIRRFLNFSERAAREAGLEPHQHQALLVIKGLPSGHRPTIGVLAKRLQIQHHSAVELTDRLETSGLLRRMRNKSDRREVLLRLTPHGEKLLRRLSVIHRMELRVAGPQLLQAIDKAIGNLNQLRSKQFLSSGARRVVRRRNPQSK